MCRALRATLLRDALRPSQCRVWPKAASLLAGRSEVPACGRPVRAPATRQPVLLQPRRREEHRWSPRGGRSIGSLSSLADPVQGPFLEGVALEAEIARFARKKPHAMSLTDVLGMESPREIASFIHNEVPIRFAERIRTIEGIEGWQDIDELQSVHARHVQVFRDIRQVKGYPNVASFSDPSLVLQFNEVISHAAVLQQDVQLLVARALHQLHTERPEKFTEEYVDHWLDDFLLNWIGSEMLLSQYLTFSHGSETGIIDPNCDVTALCREVAVMMQEVCKDLVGRVPIISVESHSASGDDRGAPVFAYIPAFLKYMLLELLKNAARATLDNTSTDRELQQRPILIVVCADEHEVAIRVSDKAKGIPFDVGDRVFSYLYSTSRKVAKAAKGGHYDVDATPLAGYGVGLPLSRLYARYLGGYLGLTSWPGYGTDVHLFLPRPHGKLVEQVPDKDGTPKRWTREQANNLLKRRHRLPEKPFRDFFDWAFTELKMKEKEKE